MQWYVVVALQALMHCGLLQTLEEAGRSTARTLASRAAELLRELLVLAKNDRMMVHSQRLRLHQLVKPPGLEPPTFGCCSH